MENPSFIEILNVKISTLVAGLLGAFLTSLRKNDGTLQARLGGYLIAVITILYVLPFLIFLCEIWVMPHFCGNCELPTRAENLISFIFGTLAKSLAESFIDSPMGSVKRWASNIGILRKLFSLSDLPADEKEKKDEL